MGRPVRNTSEIRWRHTLEVIRLLRREGGLSVPRLAHRAGLSVVTTLDVVDRLREAGLVVQSGITPSRGGRRAMGYDLDRRFGFLVGQRLGRRHVSTSVRDLGMGVLYASRVPLDAAAPESVLDLMVREARRALDEAGQGRDSCLGVGLSLPGQVDHRTGVVMHLSGLPGWENVPVRAVLEEALGLPCHVDNDSNALALAAKWTGLVEEDVDAVVLSLGEGLGAGVLSKGSLLYGSHSNAGEVGHMTIRYDGAPCPCGNRGCLETFVSDGALLDRMRSCGLADSGPDSGTGIRKLVDLAETGNPEALALVREAGGFLGIGLDHVVKAYDPDTIVVHCDWLMPFPELARDIVEGVFARCPWVRRDRLRIRLGSVEDIEGIGPSALVLEALFADPATSRLVAKLERDMGKGEAGTGGITP